MKSFMRGIVDHKGLLSILAVLVVAIIGLTAGIIIINNTNTPPTEDIPESTVFIRDYDAIEAEAKALLVDGKANVGRVIEIYKEVINDSSKRKDNPSYVSRFILSKSKILSEAGYKREALDELIDENIDDLNLDNKEIAEIYGVIIELARELGDENTVNEYKEKHNINLGGSILR